MGKNQWVVPHGDGWAQRGEGNERVTRTFDRQEDAIDAARETARREHSELLIQGERMVRSANATRTATTRTRRRARTERGCLTAGQVRDPHPNLGRAREQLPDYSSGAQGEHARIAEGACRRDGFYERGPQSPRLRARTADFDAARTVRITSSLAGSFGRSQTNGPRSTESPPRDSTTNARTIGIKSLTHLRAGRARKCRVKKSQLLSPAYLRRIVRRDAEGPRATTHGEP